MITLNTVLFTYSYGTCLKLICIPCETECSFLSNFETLVFFLHFFSIQLLSVLRGHSFFPSRRATTANDLRLRRIFIQILLITFFFPILILEKEQVFPFFILSAKRGNYWYHFYNVFGMTLSLTGD